MTNISIFRARPPANGKRGKLIYLILIAFTFGIAPIRARSLSQDSIYQPLGDTNYGLLKQIMYDLNDSLSAEIRESGCVLDHGVPPALLFELDAIIMDLEDACMDLKSSQASTDAQWRILKWTMGFCNRLMQILGTKTYGQELKKNCQSDLEPKPWRDKSTDGCYCVAVNKVFNQTNVLRFWISQNGQNDRDLREKLEKTALNQIEIGFVGSKSLASAYTDEQDDKDTPSDNGNKPISFQQLFVFALVFIIVMFLAFTIYKFCRKNSTGATAVANVNVITAV